MTTIYPKASLSPIKAQELPEAIGQRVKIHGIIYKIREMSGFAFVLLRSGNTLLQCLWSQESGFPLHALREGMAVIFSGLVAVEERSRSGCELRILGFEELSRPAADPPVVINNKEVKATLDTLLDYRPLTLRNQKERAIFRVQAAICEGLRGFLGQQGFIEIHSPKICSGTAEGGADVFDLAYFDKQAFLAQSPQFYKQMMVGVFERVYEIGPVFRAEKHHSSRHINQYTSVDLELSFIKSFYEIMELEAAKLLCPRAGSAGGQAAKPSTDPLPDLCRGQGADRQNLSAQHHQLRRL